MLGETGYQQRGGLLLRSTVMTVQIHYPHTQKCYNRVMDWRRLERWAIIATIALYVAAAASLAIMLGESLLLEGSSQQRAFHDIANYLNRLGEIAGGMIIVIVLLILVGGGTGMLFLKAYDQFQENRKRRARERAEAVEEGKAIGIEQGRTEGRAEILDELRERGFDVDDLLSPDESDTEPPATP